MKKWIVILILVAGIGFAGYKYAYHLIGNKIMDQLADEVMNTKEVDQMLADPDVKRMIESSLNANDVKQLLGAKQGDAGEQGSGAQESQGASAPAKKMVVKNKNEAIKLVMNKFSVRELKDMASRVNGGMSETEKESMKQQLTDRFTKDELDSLKIIALMETEKRKG